MSSLRVRLVVSHLIVIMLAMGVASVLLLSFLESYFLRSTEDSLIAQAHLIVQAIVPGARAAAPPSTRSAASRPRNADRRIVSTPYHGRGAFGPMVDQAGSRRAARD